MGLDFGSYEYTHPLTQRHKYSGGNPEISGTIEDERFNAAVKLWK